MNEREHTEQAHGARKGRKPASIHFVLNWTHMSVFLAVAAIGLITLNQGFAGVDRRIDDMNLRMDERFEIVNQRMDERFDGVERRIDRVEIRLDRVEGELSDINIRLSDINARLAVVENIVGAQANAEVESPSAAVPSDSDL
ncbi:MAG: hypothetical protein OXI17_06530 [Gammaproteobacteria bacterium]|nr:hypothetical protein [Gammaproteobacteria bacterium]MDE0478226.1 hypothetical protein [Gammaproteobacteria bacterium]MDE0508278.1 hypothetical protein [Gammaproteobacteria bacterium]